MRNKDKEAATSEEEQPRLHLRFLVLFVVRQRERTARQVAGEEKEEDEAAGEEEDDDEQGRHREKRCHVW